MLWMNHENMLQEISQTWKDKCCMILLVWNVKFIGTESNLEVNIKGEGSEDGEYCLMVTEFPFGVMKKFWK